MANEQAETDTDRYESSYDLAAYINAAPEQRLMILQEAWKKTADERLRTFFEGQMMGVSIDLDEHPEGFEHGCMCATCLSYGD